MPQWLLITDLNFEIVDRAISHCPGKKEVEFFKKSGRFLTNNVDWCGRDVD